MDNFAAIRRDKEGKTMRKQMVLVLVVAVTATLVVVSPVKAGGGSWEQRAEEAHIVVVTPANMAGTHPYLFPGCVVRSPANMAGADPIRGGFPPHRAYVFHPSGGYLPPDGENTKGVICFPPSKNRAAPCVDTHTGVWGIMDPEKGIIWDP